MPNSGAKRLIAGTSYPLPQVVMWELRENGALFECSEVRASHKCVAAHRCVAIASCGTCTFPQCKQRADPYSGIIVRPWMTRFLSLFHSFVSLFYSILLPSFPVLFILSFVPSVCSLLLFSFFFLPPLSFLLLHISQQLSFCSEEWHVACCGALRWNEWIRWWTLQKFLDITCLDEERKPQTAQPVPCPRFELDLCQFPTLVRSCLLILVCS